MNTPYREPTFGRFWFFLWFLVLLAVAYSTLGCGASLTGPSGHSYRIPVIGGTPEQEALANDAWKGLQGDLAASGMDGAPLSVPPGLRIVLEPLVAPDEIYYPGGGTALSYLSNDGVTIHVPQGFEGYRHVYALLRHEMAHAHCHAVIGGWCTNGAPNQASAHVWPLPNGKDLWLLVWADGR